MPRRSAAILPCRAVTAASADLSKLEAACENLKRAPPSEKLAFSKDVAAALKEVAATGALPKWGAGLDNPPLQRRPVALGELRLVGIKAPDAVAKPTVRNDAAFLATVVGGSSILAVLAGALLPGDLSGFGAYLAGGISIATLAIGSTAPGLLSFFIDKFSRVFPDYRERVRRHEAAHFLVAHLLRLPVTGYSLDINSPHTSIVEAEMEGRLIENFIDEEQAARYATVAMAGIAGEGRWSPEIVGQNADLMDLQRILNRTRIQDRKLSDADQQNFSRWAVWTAARLLRDYPAEYEALQAAMERGAGLVECIRAIEDAKSPAA